ncbi:MAG: endoribonuclease YicC domain-containing protein, partial [Planktomarina sp.]
AIQRLGAEAIEPDRLAQEMAILAVKSDITEELDRLDGHIEAAKTLLADSKPIGRRMDFLMQEFNREVNTLCSKSGSRDLTKIGLDLKVVIDQMREQVQNVE